MGFEPTKHIALDLKSSPFDRSGILPVIYTRLVYMLLYNIHISNFEIQQNIIKLKHVFKTKD